ncbi:hypothetical protein NDU88_004030 [Pleurodeles waltl]|uniref:Uncharacterized protein n=1 Tax=Pleurodeles waltl TaxID=8319 RepID=A0AAV7RFJ7_PLEWA|nr:hypothetical protein NDU88_004030 [Pleurodeles waltl]
MTVPGSKGKSEVKCSLYMDDVSVFCVDGRTIKELEKTCIEFRKASGANINSAKSETLLLGHWTPTRDPLPFPIKQDFLKILQVWFGREGVAEKSWEERLAKTKQKLGLWSFWKLMIEGKSLVLRNETLPVLQYIPPVWSVQRRTAKAITRMIFYFIWNAKMERVKREVMLKTHDKGGKGVPDITTILRGTFEFPSAGALPARKELQAPWPLKGEPPAPWPLKGEPPAPWPLKGEPPAPWPLKGETPAPWPLKGETPAPWPLKGETPAPCPLKGETPAPCPLKGETPAPCPLKGETPGPCPLKGETPGPCPLKGETPAPCPLKGETRAPCPLKGETRAPCPLKGETRAPCLLKGESLAPQPQKGEQQPPPHTPKEYHGPHAHEKSATDPPWR